MMTLVLNAAESRVQFVLAEGERVVCFEDWEAASKGTELLPPLLDEALAHAGVSAQEVTHIACVAGPGSFTGIRLGLTLTAGLRRATGALVAGLNYLQAIAATFALANPQCAGKKVRVVTHARRGLVHCQDFILSERSEGVAPLPLDAPQIRTIDEACTHFATPSFVLGSGVARNAEAFALSARSTPHVQPLAGVCEHPGAAALLLLTRDATWGKTDLSPMYLRPCDAVDNLPAIATKRGQAPAEAQAELQRLLNLR